MTKQPDYLLIGHVAHDITPAGPKLGGTMSYAGNAALAMGAEVAIVTSARKDDVVLRDLKGTVHLIEAPASTVFENTYTGDRRRQILHSRAAVLHLADIPELWRRAPIVHLGPLDDEVDLDLVTAFPNALVAATTQGWMRTWNAEGVVSPKQWDRADHLLPVLDATIFSEEDIGLDRELEAYYASLAKLLVITRASKGCTIYQKEVPPIHISAPTVNVVDATGAGDVFAGFFLVMLHRTGNVRRSAEVATQLASISVTRAGLDGIPTATEIQDVLSK